MSAHAETLIPLELTVPDSYWKEIFNKYDYDKDGEISYVDFKTIMQSSDYGKELSDHVAYTIMKLADKDSSGVLNLDGFLHLVNKARATPPRHQRWLYVLENCLEKYVDAIVPQRSLDYYPAPGYGAPREGVILNGVTVRFGGDEDELGLDRRRQTFKDGELELTSLEASQRPRARYCWPPAVLMLVISVLDVYVFWHNAGTEDVADGPLTKMFIYYGQQRLEAWRFLSYMLVHLDPLHLITNVLVQMFLGLPLEIRHSWWRVLLVYVAGGLGGSLANSLVDPLTPVAGSSGAVYALSAAHVAHLFICRSKMSFCTAALQLVGFGLLVVKDISVAVFSSSFNMKTTYIHYAGAAAGLLVGIGVFYDFKGGKKLLWKVAVGLFCALTLAAILANIFWTEHFTPAPE